MSATISKLLYCFLFLCVSSSSTFAAPDDTDSDSSGQCPPSEKVPFGEGALIVSGWFLNGGAYDSYAGEALWMYQRCDMGSMSWEQIRGLFNLQFTADDPADEYKTRSFYPPDCELVETISLENPAGPAPVLQYAGGAADRSNIGVYTYSFWVHDPPTNNAYPDTTQPQQIVVNVREHRDPLILPNAVYQDVRESFVTPWDNNGKCLTTSYAVTTRTSYELVAGSVLTTSCGQGGSINNDGSLSVQTSTGVDLGTELGIFMISLGLQHSINTTQTTGRACFLGEYTNIPAGETVDKAHYYKGYRKGAMYQGAFAYQGRIGRVVRNCDGSDPYDFYMYPIKSVHYQGSKKYMNNFVCVSFGSTDLASILQFAFPGVIE